MQPDRIAKAGPGASSGLAIVPTAAVRELGLELRPETDQDVPFLSLLYTSMRWDELIPVTEWSDGEKLAFLEQQFGAQRTHYLRAYGGGGHFLVVERGGQPVGRLYLFRSSRDIRVVDIGLLPEFRNQGFGAALLGALFAEAQASGRTVSVHVEVFNPAQRLYERLGFREAGEEGPYRLMVWHPSEISA